ncbi:rhomboid family intramembrane serine protease [Aliiglaciecola sp. CAU 1673]|uniref:rhomboid family intramembrane serine protease n=1 Tax=Aliiglaciecola sp. CAU 1673 TaxID=3032595 RepID=UPI0023DBD8B5|nr:rhomboid family intramembrane serine protease [Aliiglaciecola sp. CAU 1673]MDF2177260.1 rhomboid family intramembrane serine protease [Aliiglaciecola sp. CAU 1673]
MTQARLRSAMLISVLFLCFLWWIKLFESFSGIDLGAWGLRPLEPMGLIGILTGPLLHGSYSHLFANSLPILILGSLFIYGYPRAWKRAVVLIWLLSGLGVWLFARQAIHLGASGLNHGLFFFLLLSSIIRRDKRSVGLMMIGAFLYGGMLMSIFPREPNISFEYHFFGAMAGLLASLLFQHLDPKPAEKKYPWEGESKDSEDPLIGDEWQSGSKSETDR